MIDLLPLALPSFVAPVVASIGGAQVATPSFGQALDAMLDGSETTDLPMVPPRAGRQGAAEDGKPLPVPDDGLDDAVDATMWICAMPMAVAPVASPMAPSEATAPPAPRTASPVGAVNGPSVPMAISSVSTPEAAERAFRAVSQDVPSALFRTDSTTPNAASGDAAASMPETSVASPPSPPLASPTLVSAGNPLMPAVPQRTSAIPEPISAPPTPARQSEGQASEKLEAKEAGATPRSSFENPQKSEFHAGSARSLFQPPLQHTLWAAGGESEPIPQNIPSARFQIGAQPSTALQPQLVPRADTRDALAAAPVDVRNALASPSSISAPAPTKPDAVASAAPTERDAASPSIAPRAPVPAIVVSTLPQPARAVFAAAIAAASNRHERAPRGELDETTTVGAAAPLVVAERSAVHASDLARVPVDLGSDRGLRQVIDRIETLRNDLHDAADARDTRLRLTPERLGAVDVAVRRDSDGVRVHFTAEREATQALLVDAQPRLTELAAQRGVRIAEASVSTGTSHNPGSQQHGAPPQQRPAATVRAPAPAEIPDTDTDTRLA